MRNNISEFRETPNNVSLTNDLRESAMAHKY